MELWKRPKKMGMTIGVIDGAFPSVIISAQAAAKMEALVACCDIEISWFATVDKVGNDYRIDDVFVPPQLCSMGGTIFEEINLLSPFMGPDGKIPREYFPLISRMKVWGHSHHTMAVFASQTDEAQAKDFIAQMEDYFIRVICNKAGEMNVGLYLLDQGLVLNHPKIIHEKAENEVFHQHMLASEVFPFDAWAVDLIESRVTRFQYKREKQEDGEGDDNGDIEIVSMVGEAGRNRETEQHDQPS